MLFNRVPEVLINTYCTHLLLIVEYMRILHPSSVSKPTNVVLPNESTVYQYSYHEDRLIYLTRYDIDLDGNYS